MLYIIKANLILALLCLLFQVLMHRDTFFGVRRLMLWGIYATAFLLPLCNLQALLTADTAATDMAEAYANYVLPTLNVTAMRVASFGVEQNEPGCGMWFVGMMALWGLIYLIPVMWMTAKLIMQVTYIIYLRCTCRRMKSERVKARPHGTLDPSRSEKYELPNTTEDKGNSNFSLGGEADIFHSSFYYFPRPCSPFSFGPWIFIYPEGMDEQTLREVLIHEQAHVRGWHTLDILFSQLVCILFWWNPAAWVMRREVRLNLEFIADKEVADYLERKSERVNARPRGTLDPSRSEKHNSLNEQASNSDSYFSLGGEADIFHFSLKMYQYRLLGFSTQTNVATIANNFNVLPLKRRITMMNMKRTSRMGMTKYALFVPVAAAMLFACNLDSLARSIAETVKKPLLIVDGQRVGEEEILALTPEHIDHITVLREASAVSVYGDEAKDGAVVIDRKKSIEASDSTKVCTVVQAISDADDNIYADVEQMPEYPGGIEAMNKVLYQNVRYPATAQDHGIQGMVIVNFVVEKDGTLSNVKATEVRDVNTGAILPEVKVVAYSRDDRQKARKHGKLTDELKEKTKANQYYAEGIKALKAESERVVRLLPERWKAGRNAGQPVRVHVTLPVTFKLQ